MLLAHHFEMAFVPIYFGQLVVGIWAGWHITTTVINKLRP